MSLRQLSVITGYNRGYLSRVERRLAGASDHTLRGIAEALEVPVAAINREEAP
ncbi:transcriptional regulator with XRE-family HTH domain [Kitasatospora gansuensis]|uniref:Transcriptional regulator with XRE-family HTH domain n=3 Tax=Streptomycetaceae TaxID=2062 RepID=A0A7W7WKF9_9ACTN|nr:transcriptional regulator with XRE-family HTH domain [Kitasatospora gansuensis]